MANHLDTLTEVFRQVFDKNDIVLKPETTARDIPEWDSLMHIQLIVAIEAKFGVRFTPGEIENVKNVGQFVQLIESKISGS